jgi:hypothetical protein
MPPTTQPNPRHAAIAALLSAPRLAPYLSAASGNVKDALRLYQWNVEISGALYECLHQFEVVLRNAIDEQLCTWNGAQTHQPSGTPHARDWLMDPSHLLQRLTGDDIPKALRRARAALRAEGRAPGHADVLAQLSFGTWRFLLPDRDPGRRLLWTQALRVAFPHLTGGPRTLVDNVDHIYRLRNRVAHLEPLLNSAMVADRFTRMRSVMSAIDPVAEQWVVSRQRVTPILRAKPAPPQP